MKTKTFIVAAVAMLALAFGSVPAQAGYYHHHHHHGWHHYHHGYYHHYGYYHRGYVRTAPVVIINP